MCIKKRKKESKADAPKWRIKLFGQCLSGRTVMALGVVQEEVRLATIQLKPLGLVKQFQKSPWKVLKFIGRYKSLLVALEKVRPEVCRNARAALANEA